MGLKFNRQDARLGAIPAGCYVTDTTTTSRPLDLPNRAVDWDVLPSGAATQILTVNSDGSIGWANPATSGTVTSVSFTGDGTVLSNTASTAVTSSGTVTAALNTQTKNYVLAGPTSGSAAAPTFRALTTADLPTTQSYGANNLTLQTASGQVTTVISTVALSPNYSAAGNVGVLIDTYSNSGTLSYPLGTRTAATYSSPQIMLGKNSSAGTNRFCGQIDANFNTSTDASWTGNLLLYAGDNTSSNAGKQLGFQVQSNASAPLIGFYGTTPVVKPVGGGGNSTTTTAGSTTNVFTNTSFPGASGSSAYTIGDIVTALKALGLLTA